MDCSKTKSIQLNRNKITMELKRTNSASELERFIGSLNPHESITVTESSQFWYVYSGAIISGPDERIVYEGPVRNFKF